MQKQMSASKSESSYAQVSQEQAAEALWAYYKANKPQLHNSVKDYKDSLLARLMAGVSAAQAFAPFVLPPEPPEPPKLVPKTRKARALPPG